MEDLDFMRKITYEEYPRLLKLLAESSELLQQATARVDALEAENRLFREVIANALLPSMLEEKAVELGVPVAALREMLADEGHIVRSPEGWKMSERLAASVCQ